ncbi:Ser/Thr protein phosphatase [Rhizodiscina lignyota]|uniref:Ser/Thr protein phosphatase n=1 Tax=Rhizodiscina lignyota TaxID=1504668 RepID=A0A9P4M4P2_9PEZI|nr:Ser/Thr protein phosphatase [Rhizodiscina lignyota]
MPDYLSWILLAVAGGAFAAQPEAPQPIAAPLRELPWAQLNFLHTTDTHGWHGGHLQEPSFSGDWGDYVSFAKHMRDKADADGSDLLLIDTGDRIEGNGLYDASEPKGQYAYDIVKQQQIDLICTGNHELYKANSSEDEFYFTVPNFKDGYLASNLDIYNPDNGKLEPLAPRYKKFTTKNQGIRILTFGFLFDFQGNANNTVVHMVEDTTKEDWFQEAIRDRDVDLILVFGHVAIRSKEYDHLFKTIRSVQWDTPIAFFGGHTHIRDYKTYDSKAAALESGRYMETIGFMSISGLHGTKSKKPNSTSETDIYDDQTLIKGPKFARRYIDNNLFSLYHHSGKNDSTFPTEHGKNTSIMISKARHKLELDSIRGCAPQDFFLNRAPYPHASSILSLLELNILPDSMAKAPRVDKEDKKAIVLTNTGAIRFDIFKGPYTHDTEYLVSPFTSGFRYVPDVPYDKAKRVIDLMNNEGPLFDDIAKLTGLEKWMLLPPEQYQGRKDVHIEPVVESESDTQGWLDTIKSMGQTILRPVIAKYGDKKKDKLIPGYTTQDDLGNDGDDTVHSRIAFYNVPNCIQSPIGFNPSDEDDKPKEPEVVDVAYNEFIEAWVLLALKYLGHDVKQEDTAVFMQKTMTDILTEWVQEAWPPKKGKCG